MVYKKELFVRPWKKSDALPPSLNNVLYEPHEPTIIWLGRFYKRTPCTLVHRAMKSYNTLRSDNIRRRTTCSAPRALRIQLKIMWKQSWMKPVLTSQAALPQTLGAFAWGSKLTYVVHRYFHNFFHMVYGGGRRNRWSGRDVWQELRPTDHQRINSIAKRSFLQLLLFED